jgi:hypothetical protein
MPEASPDVGEIELALVEFLAELEFAPSDPRNVIASVARRLAQACDRRPSGALAGELRTCVSHLSDAPNVH